MAAQSSTWDEDPQGVSLLLATGRVRHALRVIAEPALLTELDEAWGRPASRVRLSFLPGVRAPGGAGQEDALVTYEKDGLGVLIARGRTSLFEGRSAARTTAFARIAAGARVRAALLATRASSLGALTPGDVLAVRDHLSLTGTPLFPAIRTVEAAWDTALAERLTTVDGVTGAGIAALIPGPVLPTPAEALLLAELGADVVVTDSVAEAMAMAARGVRVAGLAVVDRVSARAGSGRHSGRRAAEAPGHAAGPAGPGAPADPAGGPGRARRPQTHIVRAAVESLLETLH